ncbi:MAG: hypothetical protein K5882_04890 [Bacteroidales bacterium]|nr:hypothetical protein [Bacteroidales bacterium]
MTRTAKRTAVMIGGVILLAVSLFAIFGRHTKVAESIKQQTAVFLKKEYIPNQNVDMESTMAFHQLDSVYDAFRQQFRMHYQTIATATFPDSSRIILIAEPAPFFEPDSLESICSRFTHKTSRRNFKIGYDGHVMDMAVVLGNATTENLDNLVAKISQQLYLSDYKPNAIDLLGGDKRHYFTGDNLDYQITLGEFDDWFFATGEAFIDDADTVNDLTVSDMFLQQRRGVFFSREPGLVAWSIRRDSDLSEQVGDIRRFALDADLILGALRDSATLVVIGREREASLETLPPLRVETVLLVASISSKELSQSLDINDCMAGKMGNGRDWCPTYLSRELENTELGHLLTITDVLLKDWSENGTIQEACYHYPSPGRFPFDRPLFKKLGLNELVYNWNTANTMYAIDLPEYTIYTLNRTGALPVSYFHSQSSGTSVGAQYERQAGNYFANCGNTDIARVVQYVALYQLFMDNGITYKGDLLHSAFPSNKPYLLAKPCRDLLDVLKNLTDSKINELSDTLTTLHFAAYGEEQVSKQLRQHEREHNFTYTDEHERAIYRDVNQHEKTDLAAEFRGVRSMLQGLSEEEYTKLVRYLAYPRGTTVNSRETYDRMLRAQKVNKLLRHIGKNNLPLLGVDLAKVRDYFVGCLRNSGGRYLKTPSVIVTFNDLNTTGGHNISSRISRVGSTTNYKRSSGGAPVAQATPPPASRPSTPSASSPSTDTRPSSGGSPSTSARPSTSGKSSIGGSPSSGGRPTTTAKSSVGTSSSSSAKSSSVSSSVRPSSYGSVRPRSSVVGGGARTTRGF